MPTPSLPNPSLPNLALPNTTRARDRFAALDGFLVRHQALWRPRPFTQLVLPWESLYPELAAWLRSRPLTAADEAAESATAAPPPFGELAAEAAKLSMLADLPAQPRRLPSAHQSVGIPGRKWAQIQAFAAALQLRDTPQHWLDWCAGKGHLGHLLAFENGARLTCLDHDPTLTAAGQVLSERLGVPACHRQCDVMADLVNDLDATHSPVALHACGDLHVRLLRATTALGCPHLALAPCCYNRIEGTCYAPLSTAAQASELHLTKTDLGLPLSETMTAGARQRRLRDRSMAWRLAFDRLQRDLRGDDSYLPTPSLATAWLHKPFAEFCRDLAALKELPPPTVIDWSALERAGWARLAEVRNLERVRKLFRRPLELWLVLDQVMFLEEAGYHVRYGTFCPGELTPRNIMLTAEQRRAS